MRSLINPQYEHLRPWILRLPETFDAQGTIIYDARNRIRVIEGPDGQLYNVKRYCRPLLINRLVYSLFRLPKAIRAYRNALLLKEKDVLTPEPVAVILLREWGLLAESYFVTVQVPHERRMYEFGYHSIEGYESVVRQFALFTADLHKKGVLHLDYSPGNVLFTVNEKGEASFCLVDINRMRFSDQPISFEDSCRNFERLWGGDDFFRLLAKEYAAERGWDEDETTACVLKYMHRFWENRHASNPSVAPTPTDQ